LRRFGQVDATKIVVGKSVLLQDHVLHFGWQVIDCARRSVGRPVWPFLPDAVQVDLGVEKWFFRNEIDVDDIDLTCRTFISAWLCWPLVRPRLKPSDYQENRRAETPD